MREILGLDTKLENRKGQPIVLDQTQKTPATVRDALFNMVGLAKGENMKADVKLRKIAMRLDDLKPEEGVLTIEDADFDVMVKAVEQNTTQYPAAVRGAVGLLLEEAKHIFTK